MSLLSTRGSKESEEHYCGVTEAGVSMLTNLSMSTNVPTDTKLKYRNRRRVVQCQVQRPPGVGDQRGQVAGGRRAAGRSAGGYAGIGGVSGGLNPVRTATCQSPLG